MTGIGDPMVCASLLSNRANCARCHTPPPITTYTWVTKFSVYDFCLLVPFLTSPILHMLTATSAVRGVNCDQHIQPKIDATIKFI